MLAEVLQARYHMPLAREATVGLVRVHRPILVCREMLALVFRGVRLAPNEQDRPDTRIGRIVCKDDLLEHPAIFRRLCPTSLAHYRHRVRSSKLSSSAMSGAK